MGGSALFVCLNACLNRREAEKGFGDEISRRVWAAAQWVFLKEKEVSERNAKHAAIETG